jgi:hypothetical protein
MSPRPKPQIPAKTRLGLLFGACLVRQFSREFASSVLLGILPKMNRVSAEPITLGINHNQPRRKMSTIPKATCIKNRNHSASNLVVQMFSDPRGIRTLEYANERLPRKHHLLRLIRSFSKN